MGLLKHRIEEVISEEMCIDELTKQVNADLVKVKFVASSNGQLNTYEEVVSVHAWEYFKEQGYFNFE